MYHQSHRSWCRTEHLQLPSASIKMLDDICAFDWTSAVAWNSCVRLHVLLSPESRTWSTSLLYSEPVNPEVTLAPRNPEPKIMTVSKGEMVCPSGELWIREKILRVLLEPRHVGEFHIKFTVNVSFFRTLDVRVNKLFSTSSCLSQYTGTRLEWCMMSLSLEYSEFLIVPGTTLTKTALRISSDSSEFWTNYDSFSSRNI